MYLLRYVIDQINETGKISALFETITSIEETLRNQNESIDTNYSS